MKKLNMPSTSTKTSPTKTTATKSIPTKRKAAEMKTGEIKAVFKEEEDQEEVDIQATPPPRKNPGRRARTSIKVEDFQSSEDEHIDDSSSLSSVAMDDEDTDASPKKVCKKGRN